MKLGLGSWKVLSPWFQITVSFLVARCPFGGSFGWLVAVLVGDLLARRIFDIGVGGFIACSNSVARNPLYGEGIFLAVLRVGGPKDHCRHIPGRGFGYTLSLLADQS